MLERLASCRASGCLVVGGFFFADFLFVFFAIRGSKGSGPLHAAGRCVMERLAVA